MDTPIARDPNSFLDAYFSLLSRRFDPTFAAHWEWEFDDSHALVDLRFPEGTKVPDEMIDSRTPTRFTPSGYPGNGIDALRVQLDHALVTPIFDNGRLYLAVSPAKDGEVGRSTPETKESAIETREPNAFLDEFVAWTQERTGRDPSDDWQWSINDTNTIVDLNTPVGTAIPEKLVEREEPICFECSAWGHKGIFALRDRLEGKRVVPVTCKRKLYLRIMESGAWAERALNSIQ